jgi:hypothetical protein
MERYLPLGSVVLLKGGTKKIMIYGRRQIAADTGDTYDYVACFYPEGNISEDYTFLFNHEDVETVVFTGYADEEDKEFQNVLSDIK